MMRQAARTEQGTPRLLQAVIDAMRVPELRARLLFVFAMLVIFRFLAQVPVPGVEREALADFFRQNDLFGFLDVFSGGALRSLSVVALGVFPYITASIIMQLMVPVFPQLKELSREGEAGRQRINQLTHYFMVPIAALQAFGQLTLLQQGGAISGIGASGEDLLAHHVDHHHDDRGLSVPGLDRRADNGEGYRKRNLHHHLRRHSCHLAADHRSGVPGKGQRGRPRYAACHRCADGLPDCDVHRGREAHTRAVRPRSVPRRADVPPGRGNPPAHQGELGGHDSADFRLLNHDIPGRGRQLLH